MCVHFSRKGRPRNDLYCVGRDIEPYSLTHSRFLFSCLSPHMSLYVCVFFGLSVCLDLPLVPRLHDEAHMKLSSSRPDETKREANLEHTLCMWLHLLHLCFMYASSCKRDISPLYSLFVCLSVCSSRPASVQSDAVVHKSASSFSSPATRSVIFTFFLSSVHSSVCLYVPLSIQFVILCC